MLTGLTNYRGRSVVQYFVGLNIQAPVARTMRKSNIGLISVNHTLFTILIQIPVGVYNFDFGGRNGSYNLICIVGTVAQHNYKFVYKIQCGKYTFHYRKIEQGRIPDNCKTANFHRAWLSAKGGQK